MDENFPEIPDYILNLIKSGERIDEIRIDREGNWLHNGEPFVNQRIIDFFNRSVDITKDGEYVIHYSDFVYPIVVEDAPVFVTGVRFEGFGDFESAFITLTTGGEEELGIHTLHYKQDAGLYCYVHGGMLLAKFKRSPSFQVLDRLEESDDTFFLTICGERIVLSEKLDGQ